jgi:hypothetical protein
MSVLLQATPTGGGIGSSKPGAAPASGMWGAITIDSLATGQYAVFAIVNITDGAGHTESIASPLGIVNVP